MSLLSHALRFVACAALWACGPSSPPADFRGRTDTFSISVSAVPSPPRAREATQYKVVVRDKESREPVEGGEGRIFATSRDGVNAWDGLTAGPEIGTYYGRLNYVVAGDWAVAIQFRRDSTRPLERIDWMQEVRGARGGVQ
jgi:acyl-coenzyme A synthetase/AMP-(fatty) acid ligase